MSGDLKLIMRYAKYISLDYDSICLVWAMQTYGDDGMYLTAQLHLYNKGQES